MILPQFANRHALITGPTGTGKTITVMRLIESLITSGTPVFAPDIKGDLSAMTRAVPFAPVRPTISLYAFGPDLMSRALELTEVQSGVLEVAWAWADEDAIPLDTLDHLRWILSALAQRPDSVAHIGHVTRASVGTIQRALLRLDKGAANLFGPTTFDTADLIDVPKLHLLDASTLYHSPRLYGALLLYILRDLATRLPEAGDLPKPRLVLVFDEAHTIFNDATPALLRSIENTSRLIRSKGVGLFWASQSPDDIPLIVRAQCATRIEHRRDLGVGNALVTTLDHRGNPTEPKVMRPSLPSYDLSPAPISAGDTATAEPSTPAPAWLVPLGFAVTALPFAVLIYALAMGFGPALIAIAIGFYLATR